MRRGAAITYVLCEAASPQVVTFYSVSAHSIGFTLLPEDVARRLARYPSVSALLIGRLAVDERRQGQGLGREVLLRALARATRLSEEIGVAAVVVDALDDATAGFYAKYGFAPLVDGERRLFLPVRSLAELFPR